MKCPRTTLLLASALLAGAPLTAQRELRTVFVVRHDPTLIQLDVSMLDALLGQDAQRAAIAGVEGLSAETKDRFPFRVGLDTPGDQDVRQPAGVFVGRLDLSYPEDVTADQARSVTDALLGALRDALQQRLHDAPAQALTQALRSIEIQLQAVSQQHATEREAASQRDQADSLQKELLGATLKLRSQDAVVDSLKQELQDAKRAVEEVEAARKDKENVLDSARAQVEDLRAQLQKFREALEDAKLDPNDAEAKRRSAQEIAKRIDALSVFVKQGAAQHDSHTREQIAAEQRLAELAKALDTSRVEMVRVQSMREAVEQRLKALQTDATREHVAVAHTALDHRMKLLERRRDKLSERLAALRPVELEIWR